MKTKLLAAFMLLFGSVHMVNFQRSSDEVLQ
jgi:hypothetical protein